MSELQKLGHNSFCADRDMYLLSIDRADQIPDFAIGSPHFGVLLAWHCEKEAPDVLSSIAHKLISLGGVYFCCWGNGCELLHDAIDYASMERDIHSDPVLMTTWHNDESLREVLWYFLNSTVPDDLLIDTMRSMIAITIGSSDWENECREALLNPDAFTKQVLDEDDSFD